MLMFRLRRLLLAPQKQEPLLQLNAASVIQPVYWHGRPRLNDSLLQEPTSVLERAPQVRCASAYGKRHVVLMMQAMLSSACRYPRVSQYKNLCPARLQNCVRHHAMYALEMQSVGALLVIGRATPTAIVHCVSTPLVGSVRAWI